MCGLLAAGNYPGGNIMVASIRPDLQPYLSSTISGPLAWLLAVAFIAVLVVFIKLGAQK
jgi:hypothetical protein